METTTVKAGYRLAIDRAQCADDLAAIPESDYNLMHALDTAFFKKYRSMAFGWVSEVFLQGTNAPGAWTDEDGNPMTQEQFDKATEIDAKTVIGWDPRSEGLEFELAVSIDNTDFYFLGIIEN